ncbi:MAG TPA: hypothetical protein VLA56_00120 [Pseudomonadales bacterium]|nr:hypothetical protein [Pseudomonadales bacterium]
MNWDAIGAVGEILGALAVFASLIYLGRQIRFSALATRSQMESELGQRSFQAYDPVYEGRNAEIFAKGLEDPSSLEPTDALVFDLLMHRQFGVMAEVASQIDNGIIEHDGAIVQGFSWHYQVALMKHPGVKRWLAQYPSSRDVLEKIGLDATQIEYPEDA